MISALFAGKSNPVTTAPIEVNVNLKFDEVQHKVSVGKEAKEKISNAAHPIIRKIGLILALGFVFSLTAPWLMPPLFIEEIVRMLFVCVIGLILKQESNETSKISLGSFTFEIK